jgi:hypothetical protein
MSRRIEGKVFVGCPPSPLPSPSGGEWKSFQFHIHNFATLRTTTNHYIASPKFTCNGHQWQLRLYPGGESDATEGNVSAFLCHLSEGSITTSFEIKILLSLEMLRRPLHSKRKNSTSSMTGAGPISSLAPTS